MENICRDLEAKSKYLEAMLHRGIHVSVCFLLVVVSPEVKPASVSMGAHMR
jgi:hypothetical protein